MKIKNIWNNLEMLGGDFSNLAIVYLVLPEYSVDSESAEF